MARKLRVRVSGRRGTNCPEVLAQAVTDYLLGRSAQVPTIHVPRRAS